MNLYYILAVGASTGGSFDGKRVYERNFLMDLQNADLSKQKPKGMPILAEILTKVLNSTQQSSYRGGNYVMNVCLQTLFVILFSL